MTHPLARATAFLAAILMIGALAHTVEKAIANTAYLAALAEVSRS